MRTSRTTRSERSEGSGSWSKRKGRPPSTPEAVSGGRKPQNAKFPGKLKAILSDPHFSNYIRWDDDLRGILLLDPTAIAQKVLPVFFSQQLKGYGDPFKSFRRQLIYYGFEDKRPGGSRMHGYASVCVNKDPTIRKVSDISRVLRYSAAPNSNGGKRGVKSKGPAPSARYGRRGRASYLASTKEEAHNRVSSDDNSSTSMSPIDEDDGIDPRLLPSRDSDARDDSYFSSVESSACSDQEEEEEEEEDERSLVPQRRPTSLQARHQLLVDANEKLAQENARLAQHKENLLVDNRRLRGIAGISLPICAYCYSRDAESAKPACPHVMPSCADCALLGAAKECPVCILLSFSSSDQSTPTTTTTTSSSSGTKRQREDAFFQHEHQQDFMRFPSSYSVESPPQKTKIERED